MPLILSCDKSFDRYSSTIPHIWRKFLRCVPDIDHIRYTPFTFAETVIYIGVKLLTSNGMKLLGIFFSLYKRFALTSERLVNYFAILIKQADSWLLSVRPYARWKVELSARWKIITLVNVPYCPRRCVSLPWTCAFAWSTHFNLR